MPESILGDEESGSEAEAGRPVYVKILLGAGALVALLGLARVAGGYVPALAAWVETLGVWGPVTFVLVYVAATVLFVPGAILTMAGGAIFGVIEGTLYVFGAAVLGSGAAFLISRHLARRLVEARLTKSPRFASVDAAVADNGLKITFLLRLSPIFPFNFLNYALGLTRVSFGDYMLASFGMLPVTLLYVYYGRVVGEVAALAGGAATERDAAYYGVTILGLVATIAVTAIVTRIARRALAEAEAG
jgi:uncharacterized membrane protein YdjX (TVP38/TMEM64 family)